MWQIFLFWPRCAEGGNRLRTITSDQNNACTIIRRFLLPFELVGMMSLDRNYWVILKCIVKTEKTLQFWDKKKKFSTCIIPAQEVNRKLPFLIHGETIDDTYRRFKFIMLLKSRSGRWRIWLLLRRSFSTPTKSWKAPLSMVWIWLFDSQLQKTRRANLQRGV